MGDQLQRNIFEWLEKDLINYRNRVSNSEIIASKDWFDSFKNEYEKKFSGK